MSRTFDKVRALVQRAEVRISDHGYDEMSGENILVYRPDPYLWSEDFTRRKA